MWTSEKGNLENGDLSVSDFARNRNATLKLKKKEGSIFLSGKMLKLVPKPCAQIFSSQVFQKRTCKKCLACEQALLFEQAKRASRVLARPVSLAQTGDLARRLKMLLKLLFVYPRITKEFKRTR